MGMAIIFFLMEIHMKEIGQMEKLMDKVYLGIIMGIYMKGNLKII